MEAEFISTRPRDNIQVRYALEGHEVLVEELQSGTVRRINLKRLKYVDLVVGKKSSSCTLHGTGEKLTIRSYVTNDPVGTAINNRAYIHFIEALHEKLGSRSPRVSYTGTNEGQFKKGVRVFFLALLGALALGSLFVIDSGWTRNEQIWWLLPFWVGPVSGLIVGWCLLRRSVNMPYQPASIPCSLLPRVTADPDYPLMGRPTEWVLCGDRHRVAPLEQPKRRPSRLKGF